MLLVMIVGNYHPATQKQLPEAVPLLASVDRLSHLCVQT